MGNNNNSLPRTEKNIKDFDCEVFKLGLAEMQGWRSNMEDSSLVHIASKHLKMPKENAEESVLVKENSRSFKSISIGKDSTQDDEDDYDGGNNIIYKSISIKDKKKKREIIKKLNSSYPNNSISIIGVFDGHGGSYISRFISDNFMAVFNNAWTETILKVLRVDENRIKIFEYDKLNLDEINSITLQKLEQLLIKTFLDLDELLKLNTVNNYLNDYRNYRRDDLILSNIPELLSQENLEINTDNFAYGMGSTANVVCLYENYLVVANVGDSMSVLFSEGKAIELNTEHKTSTPGEEERIKNAGMTIYNNRVDGKLNLTRAIGDFQFKNNKFKPHEQAVTAYPELTTFELSDQSEFIIIACDGIWDCVEPQKLCEYVSKSIKSGILLSSIVSSIEDMVLSKSNNSPIGTDNMTCMILQFK